MLDKKVVDLINDQINKEFYSAYLYLHFSNYYNDENLDGFSNWFNVQAQEERDHAIIFMNYLKDNDQKIVLTAIDQPDASTKNLKDPLVASLEHEKLVTASIHAIFEEASKIKDYRTMKFLEWFIDEQMEEEDSARTLIDKYDLFGKDMAGLYAYDQELAQRSYEMPAPLANTGE